MWRGPVKPSLCLAFEVYRLLFQHYAHWATEICNSVIPSMKGTVGESNLSHEEHYCAFCTVHCCAPSVNGCSHAWQRKSSCLSSVASAFSRAFCSVMLLPAVRLCHLPVLPLGSVSVCPSPVQCATWRSLSHSFNGSNPLTTRVVMLEFITVVPCSLKAG